MEREGGKYFAVVSNYIHLNPARAGLIRLGMGDESRVTRAIRRVKREGRPELERLKTRLEQVYQSNGVEAEA